MEYYAVLLLGFYTLGLMGYLDQKNYTAFFGTAINVAMWSPFLGRALGWW